MDPILVGGAIKLVTEFAPDIIGLFSKDKGSKAEKAAQVVEGIANSITGKEGDDSYEAIKSDPNLALEFKKAVMADSHIKEQMAYANIVDARDMYEKKNVLADYIAQSIIDNNLWAVGALVSILLIVNVGMPFLFPNNVALVSGIVGTVGPLVGGVITQLLKERSDVINFFFGSSLGSKLKDLGK